MAIFVFMVIMAVVVSAIFEGMKMKRDRKRWVNGLYYEDVGRKWVTARMTSDPDRVEFMVEFLPRKGLFRDEHLETHIPYELYIKREEYEEG
jgi:hypothetical protein